jgi:hypothetical protein
MKTQKTRERKATIQTIGTAKVLWLTVGKLTTAYRLEELKADFGTAFRLCKAYQGGNAEPEAYDILLAEEGATCECMGFLRHGHCKHADALAKLHQLGKV